MHLVYKRCLLTGPFSSRNRVARSKFSGHPDALTAEGGLSHSIWPGDRTGHRRRRAQVGIFKLRLEELPATETKGQTLVQNL